MCARTDLPLEALPREKVLARLLEAAGRLKTADLRALARVVREAVGGAERDALLRELAAMLGGIGMEHLCSFCRFLEDETSPRLRIAPGTAGKVGTPGGRAGGTGRPRLRLRRGTGRDGTVESGPGPAGDSDRANDDGSEAG